MGVEVEGKRLECGQAFTVSDGGGFFFHLVRCEACGETKGIGFDEIEPLRASYLKDLSLPYGMVTVAQDHDAEKHWDPDTFAEEKHHRAVESFAGNCACGGKFTLNALPRCPDCQSTHIELGEITMLYD